MMSAHLLDSLKAHGNAERSESALEPITVVPDSEPAPSSKEQAVPPQRPLVPQPVACGDYAAGTLIAQKYRLIRVLCQGGMGAVWVAHNELLDMPVALKLIRHDLRTAGLAERLITEARLAARLEHPAVVSVFDVGNTESGDPYIVMELLKGEDLREQLDREGQLDPARTIQWLLPILEGLAAAHAHGIVHRDLKPENVYFTHIEDRVQPKIVDFGIAKPTTGEKKRSVTRAGAVVGSPDYMSPEQAKGVDDVDHRADIWAFAVVLYECVTGRPPFADSSYEALLRDVVEKPVVPITERGIDEPELWAILARGLAKDRDERWQTVREMGVALAQWLRARGVDEDVCGQSLRVAWLRDSDPPRDAMGSAPLLLVPRARKTPHGSPAPVSFAPVVRTPLPTPVPATLPSPSSQAKTPDIASTIRLAPATRWTKPRKLIGLTAIVAAFVVWGLVATLATGVGTASASAPQELLDSGLTAAAQARSHSALEELSRDIGSTVADIEIPVQRSTHPRAAGFARTSTPMRVTPPAEQTQAEQAQAAPTVPASGSQRKSARRWAPFVEQDLGF